MNLRQLWDDPRALVLGAMATGAAILMLTRVEGARNDAGREHAVDVLRQDHEEIKARLEDGRCTITGEIQAFGASWNAKTYMRDEDEATLFARHAMGMRVAQGVWR